jgi:hypothetical protein
MRGTRSRTPGTKHSRGKKREKAPKSRRRFQSLIEEGAEGPLIWLRRLKSQSGRRAIDLEGCMADDLPFQRNLSGRNERLRTETPEGQIHGGNHSRTSVVTGVSRSSTSEDSY